MNNTIVSFILSIVTMACAPVALAQAPEAMKVKSKPIQLETIQEHYKVTGNLRAVSRVELAALEEGKVIEVHVDEADSIPKDGIVAKIDDRRLRAQLHEVQSEKKMILADIDERKAQLENATWNYERLKPLLAKDMTTEKALKDAETAMLVAQSQLESKQRDLDRADNRLELLQIRLDDTIVKAPFDGWVVERFAEPGEWIRPGDPIVTLVSSSALEAWLDVPERLSFQIDRHVQSVLVNIHTSGRSVQSENLKIVKQVDPRVRTFSLVATLKTDEYTLLPGMSVTSWIPLGVEMEHLTIDKNAILREGIGTYVFKAVEVQEGGHIAMSIPVIVLFETDRKAVIESNQLSAGDRVVVEGNERLRPNMPISLIE